MIINKEWAMPNKNTFSIKPINLLLEKYVNLKDNLVIDPFSNGERKFSNNTNDLNPKIDSDYHMDALDYLKMFKSNTVDIVLYDPPYSLRQVSEVYKSYGRQVTQETTQASWRRRHLDEISRIIKPDGICISFGWNTNGVGKKRDFYQKEILIVSHGGSHNDTLVTVERKE